MGNPLIEIMRQYDYIPLSAVIVELHRQGGPLRVRIIRYGGSSAAIRQDADMVLGGVTGWEWEHLPDIWIDVEGEYYRHEVILLIRAAAQYTNALDVMMVQREITTNWHYRPCNPKHWIIRKMGKRSYRMPIVGV